MVVSATSQKPAYLRAKEAEEERKRQEEERKQQQKTWVNYFLDLKEDERVFLRFLYNMLDEPTHKAELIGIRMHDYYIPSDNRYVRAVCAEEFEKPCHWCQVAAQAKKKAEAMPRKSKAEGDARYTAIKSANQKAARDTYILPCLVYQTDENGKYLVDENNRFVTERKLLALKKTVFDVLSAYYEAGFELPDGSTAHTITVCDFTYSRKGSKTDTKYTLLPKAVKPLKIAPPSRERIMEMILECRPCKEVEEEVQIGEELDLDDDPVLNASESRTEEEEYADNF